MFENRISTGYIKLKMDKPERCEHCFFHKKITCGLLRSNLSDQMMYVKAPVNCPIQEETVNIGR